MGSFSQQEGVRLIGDLSRVQAELHQAQEELRKLRPLKDALAFEQQRTKELGEKLVVQVSTNQALTAIANDMQTKLESLQNKSQQLELDLAVAKAAALAQEGVVASMLQRLSATSPVPEPGTL